MVFDPNFFNSDASNNQSGSSSNEEAKNSLLQYLEQQNPDVLAEIARSISPDAREIVSQNVQGLVGALPSEHFQVQVTTDHDNLSSMLASAMMTGYFLRQMEQRMELETRMDNSQDINS
ncbi:DUF760 domain-containing protein [Euhalothece natronophila Z-M001]|uniref:DUF760 domain-containing protein n=1 Tax=Euhalothece natronophila Z-M001 TaxID=522448 RepID=A0A5B8NQI4_9CHRO|nr:DUF760 domain-containing protein [Euhalothece natronophila]QDZ40460.1 DUF760 domain-containing protein [Euhalothece natronophila Z-M001]